MHENGAVYIFKDKIHLKHTFNRIVMRAFGNRDTLILVNEAEVFIY